jgi:hypothetical protein
MARIRSIKPELPQSESMGNVSRDARLTFIQLWTLADDEGRLRGNSRMLASLLFPYDDGEDGHVLTTAKDVEAWMVELEREGCIVRYQIDGAAYVQVANWLIHQKIDKPSKSKIPAFDDSSRILAKPREDSLEEGIKDQGKEGSGSDASAPPAADDDDRTPPRPKLDAPTPNARAIAIATLLTGAGVKRVTAFHPDVAVTWAQDERVTDQVLLAAVARAKESLGAEPFQPPYLRPIIVELLNPVERRAAPRADGQSQKFNFAGADRTGDKEAMAASMARHGITPELLAEQGDIPI